MVYDVIIIGGGAAGMRTAIQAKKNNKSVLVIEHGDRVGRKILSTGNGRCNLTNMNCRVDLFEQNPEGIYPYFTSGVKSFVEEVIGKSDCRDTLDFFGGLGLLFEIKNDYVYPRSGQASSVLDALRFACEDAGVELILNYQPISIIKNEKGFNIDNSYYSRKLVIAAGGNSACKSGSDGSGYELARLFGHQIVKPRPALCGINCSDKFFKALAGVRNDSTVKLFADGKEVIRATGNLQFNDYGLSGIPVFQISSDFGRLNESGCRLSLSVDLLPEFAEDELIHAVKANPQLLGILNKKLAKVILKMSDGSAESKVKLIKHFIATPNSLRSFDESQVTAGGVSTDEINPKTMMSRLIDGLYFAGEIIDVNGICGGYNLQWAWSTGQIAGNSI